MRNSKDQPLELNNRKGYLVENDLKRVFEILGQAVTQEDLSNMVKMVGLKGKDKITYEEFKDFFQKQL